MHVNSYKGLSVLEHCWHGQTSVCNINHGAKEASSDGALLARLMQGLASSIMVPYNAGR